MILGVGVDLLHLPRLRSILANRDPLRLATRICSPRELEQWKKEVSGDRTGEASERFLALRWAAKEAAYKALYPSFRPTWKDLDVRKVDKKPLLAFSPEFRPSSAASVAKEDVKMHLSVSHDADVLVALSISVNAGSSGLVALRLAEPGACVRPSLVLPGFEHSDGTASRACCAQRLLPLFHCDAPLLAGLSADGRRHGSSPLGFYSFGTPGYVWGVALAVSLVEGLYIAISVALIEFHVGVRTRVDMAAALLPLWAGSMVIGLSFFIGGSEATGADSGVYKIGIGIFGISHAAGLVLAIVSITLHILLLTDPDPQAHGYHPAKAWKRHRRRHHGHKSEDDDEEDAMDDGGGDDVDDYDDEKKRRRDDY
ncbi:hypothetical protein JCM10213v2_004373 [Rhodosporidiobolus nylandii]